MKKFVLASIFLLSSLNISDVNATSNTFDSATSDLEKAQELSDRILHFMKEETKYRSDLFRSYAQFINTHLILQKKGDIMLGDNSCSKWMDLINEEREITYKEFEFIKNFLITSIQEYKKLTGHPFSNPSPTNSDIESKTSPLTHLDSISYSKKFKVRSAGISRQKARTIEQYEKEASLNCSAPVTCVDPLNPTKVQLTIPLKSSPSQRTLPTRNEPETATSGLKCISSDLPSLSSLKRTLAYASFNELHETIDAEQDFAYLPRDDITRSPPEILLYHATMVSEQDVNDYIPTGDIPPKIQLFPESSSRGNKVFNF